MSFRFVSFYVVFAKSEALKQSRVCIVKLDRFALLAKTNGLRRSGGRIGRMRLAQLINETLFGRLHKDDAGNRISGPHLHHPDPLRLAT